MNKARFYKKQQELIGSNCIVIEKKIGYSSIHKIVEVITINGYNLYKNITDILHADRKEEMKEEILVQKYRKIRSLGTGGTSQVDLVEHLQLKTYRAIKSISKAHPFYTTFQKEAQILLHLKHSCIPIIYDIEEDANRYYIVEEYLEGQTLTEYLKARGRLNSNRIIFYATQLCDLIQYLHQFPTTILYLDLKPDNIMVMKDTIKLIDFGCAEYRKDTDHLHAYYGTRAYAAPEQLRHDKLDERSDIFGIGMILYTMITGESIPKDQNKIPHLNWRDYGSKELVSIINRCLRYYPSQRFASVVQLKKQLSACKSKQRPNVIPKKTVQIGVAGAQYHIGVTHLSFRLCTSFIHKKMRCLYHEKNINAIVRSITRRYRNLTKDDGIYHYNGIDVMEGIDIVDDSIIDYPIIISDYGRLTETNLVNFMGADIKILILGAMDWELESSEQTLKLITSRSDVILLFNYLNGKQFQKVLKSMGGRECYRIPYEPDPFTKKMKDEDEELFQYLTGIAFEYLESRG